MRRSFWYLVTLVALGSISGCGSDTAPPADGPESQTRAAPATPPAVPDMASALTSAGKDAPATTTPQPAVQEAEEPEMESQVATVGVGRKGRGYGGGVISEPVRAYFRTGERTVFDIQIPQAMKMYKAMDPNGKGPASHEEFMEKVIKENSIVLPDLPPGERYYYDAETEELLVQRPKK